jgi:hypothetical protein
LDLANSTGLTDTAGNAVTGLPFTGGQVYTLDRTAPTVTSIVRAGASPTNASSVLYTVNFSENVTGLAASNFSVTTTGLGGTPAVTNVAGSGATYTITVSTGTGDGTLRLNLANTTGLTDTAGNAVSNVPFTGGDVYTLDRTAPTVSSIVRAGASPTNASSVVYTVNFSENVTGLAASNFSVTITGLAGTPAVTNIAGSGAAYTITVSTGTGDGTLRLNLANSTGLTDTAGNPVSGLPFTSGQVYTLDRTAPTVSSIVRAGPSPTNASSVVYTVNFSENVTGLATSNFSVTISGLGGTPAVTNVAGSGASYTITVSTGTGDGTLRLDLANSTGLADTAGNAVSNVPFTSGDVYTLDRTAPTVTSIVAADPNPTGAASVHYTVSLSESVTGLAVSNFSVTISGLGGTPAVTNVSGSGASYTVTVSTGTGSGTLRLDLANSTGVADAAGNAVSGLPFTSGDVYTISRQSPVVTVDASTLFYAWAAPATIIAPTGTVTDSDSPNFAGGSLTAAVTTMNTSNDRLAIVNQGTGVGQIGVSGSNITYNAGSGAVVIGTFKGGSGLTPLVVSFNGNATPAAAQALLRDITYRNTQNSPPAGNRAVTFTVNDGSSGSGSATRTINVQQNQAPVLNGANDLNSIPENPTSNPGTQVSALIAGHFSDGNVGSLAGIAITAANNSNGTWQYSLDGGVSWTAIGSVSTKSALLLRDSDWVRFVPNTNFSGSASISLRGWDQTKGTAGTKTSTSSHGGTTAFSTAIATSSITVTLVVQASVVTVSSTPVNYTAGSDPTLIGTSGTVSDVDSPNLGGDSLIVSFTGGTGDVNDRLAIRNQGTGTKKIGISGSDVTYGGVVIGTFSGGTDGSTPLVITFNTNATVAAVQALLGNITYSNVGTPAPATKTVQFVIDDGPATITNPAVRTINIV